MSTKRNLNVDVGGNEPVTLQAERINIGARRLTERASERMDQLIKDNRAMANEIIALRVAYGGLKHADVEVRAAVSRAMQKP